MSRSTCGSSRHASTGCDPESDTASATSMASTLRPDPMPASSTDHRTTTPRTAAYPLRRCIGSPVVAVIGRSWLFLASRFKSGTPRPCMLAGCRRSASGAEARRAAVQGTEEAARCRACGVRGRRHRGASGRRRGASAAGPPGRRSSGPVLAVRPAVPGARRGRGAAPRVVCPVRGVVVAAVPRAGPGSRFTAAFEDQAAWLCAAMSTTKAAELLRATVNCRNLPRWMLTAGNVASA